MTHSERIALLRRPALLQEENPGAANTSVLLLLAISLQLDQIEARLARVEQAIRSAGSV